MLPELDVNNDGTLDFIEFLKIMVSKNPEIQKIVRTQIVSMREAPPHLAVILLSSPRNLLDASIFGITIMPSRPLALKAPCLKSPTPALSL